MKTIKIPLVNPDYPVGDAAASYHRGRIDHVINLGSCITRFALGVVRRGDDGRREMYGPMIPGPWAYTVPKAGVIDNYGGSRAASDRRLTEGTEHTVKNGDQLIIDGETYSVAVRGRYVDLILK